MTYRRFAARLRPPLHTLAVPTRIVVLLFISALLLVQTTSANASQAWGSINNFDTVNDTGDICHGFEIEIEGIHSRDITYTYDWNHYGAPKIREDNSDPQRPRVFVRYESGKNADGSWSTYTAVPTEPILPTDGHKFVDPSINFGGEHFGVGFYGVPAAVKYCWLKDDGAGNLVFAGAVNIATPTFNYFPPVGLVPPIVQAAIVPPPPPDLPVLEFGPASWVKVTRTTSHNDKKVELRDLVSDDPDDPDDRNWKNGEPDEVEFEWELMQTEFKKGDGGPNGFLEGGPQELEDDDEIVTVRYDFFKYVGPLDPETGEALADKVGEDGIHGVDEYADVVIVGDYIGAQMAGFDPGAQIGLIDHLQDGTVNVPYVERTIVVGGTAPILTTRSGNLPPGMVFDEMTGVLSGTPTSAGTFTFTVHSMDAAAGDVTATFFLTIVEGDIIQPPHITVSVLASPPAGGLVTGGGEYETGAVVTVEATENPGYEFVAWTDGGTVVSDQRAYVFIAEVNRELIATFVRICQVAVSASPSDGGVVNGGGTYRSGDTVTVEAIPNGDHSFVNWTENGQEVSTLPLYSFVVAGDRTLVANFANAHPTRLSMAAFQGKVGAQATISATLIDKVTKAYLQGQLVQFWLDGQEIGPQVSTGPLGKARFTFLLPDGFALGEHIVSATFTGAAGYGPSVTSSTLTVTQGKVKLTVPPVTGGAGQTVTLKARLTTYADIPLAGRSLVFTAGGPPLGAATTQANGDATLVFNIPAGTPPGTYLVEVTFAGDEGYLPTTKTGRLIVR